MSFALKIQGLKQLKMLEYLSRDRFHAYGHSKTCPCNPRTQTPATRRIHGLLQIAEGTFNWFRGCSKVLNDVRPERRRLAVFYYCKLRNGLVSSGSIQHLNQRKTSGAKKPSKSYECNSSSGKQLLVMKSKKIQKGSKTMKTMNAMK